MSPEGESQQLGHLSFQITLSFLVLRTLSSSLKASLEDWLMSDSLCLCLFLRDIAGLLPHSIFTRVSPRDGMATSLHGMPSNIHNKSNAPLSLFKEVWTGSWQLLCSIYPVCLSSAMISSEEHLPHKSWNNLGLLSTSLLMSLLCQNLLGVGSQFPCVSSSSQRLQRREGRRDT